MDEKKVISAEESKKPEKQDYYSPVVVKQFFICLVLVVTVLLLTLYGGSFGEQVNCSIRGLINYEPSSDTVESVINTVRDFFMSGDSFAVFNSEPTQKITDGSILRNDI